jgi:hypothetical protein
MNIEIVAPSHPLRTDFFKTRARDRTTSIFVGYLNSPPDPRIGAKVADQIDAGRSYFGVRWNFILKVDGTIEHARGWRTIPAAPSKPAWLAQECISIGIVGGIDWSLKHANTITPEQEASLEALMQHLANTLQVPLEVTDRVTDLYAPEEVFKQGFEAVEEWREERLREREETALSEMLEEDAENEG